MSEATRTLASLIFTAMRSLSDEEFDTLVRQATTERGRLPIARIYSDEADPQLIRVVSDNVNQTNVAVAIHVGPNPTWPSPSEMYSMVGMAVTEMLDTVYEAETGQEIDRRS